MYKIQDGEGTTFSHVKNPAAVYDIDGFVLLKIGEFEAMKDYFTFIQDTYQKNGFHALASNIYLISLPKDQGEIDKVFQNSNYIKKFHLELKKDIK